LSSRRHRVHLFASRLHQWLALFIGVQLLIWFARKGAAEGLSHHDHLHSDQRQ